ncbi:hypothetical protein C7451_107123 [Blastomonas natatoria]|uniref:Lipoprotein n=1 Tax=Blastomonas natatoria TaxID=34015 RepID=A0A2V3V256_9SPHN|nr:hypothetical protein [Blastomonas natatoria]PXW75154.1 hypothetical protein C7451_107123 [Blastomonas natatoria]
MSLRISDALPMVAGFALLAACSTDTAPPDPADVAGGDDSRIACALAGEAEFAEKCDVERVQGGDRRELVLRHPDGGFRRFEIVTDGRGLVSADGAEEAVVTPLSDGRIQLSVGDDRYRIPATIKPGAGGG